MVEIRPIYFDSALIAKFYLNEPGRDIVRGLAREAGMVLTSAIAVAEISAAFHRKYREGAIDADVFSALAGQFAHDLKAGLWTFIPITDALLEAIGILFAGLSSNVFLRSLDAVHLVTAKAQNLDRIYTNDRRLLAACPAVRIVGVNPIADRT